MRGYKPRKRHRPYPFGYQLVSGNEFRSTDMAKKVGCGDLGALVGHLKSIVTDVENGNISDVWTHVWGALDEIRAASGNCVKPMFSAVAGGNTHPAMTTSIPQEKRENAVKACGPIKEFVAAHEGMSAEADTSGIDFKSLFQKLLAFIAALLG